LVLRVTSADMTDVCRYSADTVEIGRRPSNDLVLEDARIAARHVRLARGPRDQFTLTVLARLMKTAVNGQAVRGEVRLDEGDVVKVGPYELEPLDRAPPCAQEREFLATLARSVDDPETRAVYADWLEERERHDEAAFLRVQIEVREAIEEGGAPLWDSSARLRELAAKVPLGWRRATSYAPIENCDVGFEVVCTKQWAALTRTKNENERFCDACQKTVFYSPDVETARDHTRLQRCVAIDLAEPRTADDLKPRLTNMRMGMIILRR
jgi:uncharacterized protein (TIGR02996 family)